MQAAAVLPDKYTATRPSGPADAQTLRNDPALLERVLDFHTSKEIKVVVPPSSPSSDQPAAASASSNGAPAFELPSACWWIRAVVRGSDNGASMKAAISRAPAAVCGKLLRVGDVAFRCLDCFADDTVVMCRTCFEASPCVGHNYKQYGSGGGSCDCGDREAIKPTSFCKHHQGISEDKILSTVPPPVRRYLDACLRHSLRLCTRIFSALRAADRRDVENDASNARLLAMAAASVIKELVEIVAMSDDGRRLVSMALASQLPPGMEVPLAPVGGESARDFAAQRKKEGAATRQRDDVDSDGFVDMDDDGDVEAGGGEGEGNGDVSQSDGEEGEEDDDGGADDDGEEVTPQMLAEAEGDEELQGELLMRLINQMRRADRRRAREERQREAQAAEDQQQQQQQQPAASRGGSSSHADPGSAEDMLMAQAVRDGSASMGRKSSSLSPAGVDGGSSAAALMSAAVTTLEQTSFIEAFLTFELCPFSSRPTLSAAWSSLKTLFDAAASDLVFRKAYTRAIMRLALPWASAYCRSGGLFSVAVQCLTVTSAVEEFLVPQQNVSDGATLISSLLCASLLNTSQAAVTVEEANKRVTAAAAAASATANQRSPTGGAAASSNNKAGKKKGAGENNNNSGGGASPTEHKVYQIPKSFPRNAFAHISFEAYHPLMCSRAARTAALISRPLLRAYLSVLSMLHYNYFWRNEQAAPMGRTSWDIEHLNARRLFQYARAANETVRGLLSESAVDLAAALGMPSSRRDLLDAIFDDVALHPVVTHLEFRSPAFHALVQLASVAEPQPRLPMLNAAPAQRVAVLLQRLLADVVFFIARQERAIAKSDARSRSQGGTMWAVVVPDLERADGDAGDAGSSNSGGNNDTSDAGADAAAATTFRLLQRPYDILHEKHLIGFHFPLYRFFSAIVIHALRGVSSSSSRAGGSAAVVTAAQQQHILRSAVSAAFARVCSADYSDALHNALDRVVGCHVLGAQQLDSLWKRDFAGYTPHLNLYGSIDPTYYNELDMYFLQCVAATVGARVLSRLVLERFSYMPQEQDRIDDKAVPLGYGHALRLLLTVATDPTRTCATAKGEVAQRLLTRLAVQGAEVRSRLQAQCTSSEVDDEESGAVEEVFNAVLTGGVAGPGSAPMTQTSRRRDATVYALTDAAWSLVPTYTAAMPGSFPVIARTHYQERIGSKSSSSSSSQQGGPAIKPQARTGIDVHGPAFRESLPLLLHEADVVASTAVFLLLCRAHSLTTDTTAAAAQQHPLSTLLRFGRAWRGRKGLTVPPTSVCVAIDALYLAAKSVFDLVHSGSNNSAAQAATGGNAAAAAAAASSSPIAVDPDPTNTLVDWPRFEAWIATERSKQWSVTSMAATPSSSFSPLVVEGGVVDGKKEHTFSYLLRSITGINLACFPYYSNAKEFTASSGSTAMTGVDVLEALLSNGEATLSDVEAGTGCSRQLRFVVAVARDYEVYARDPAARAAQLAAQRESGGARTGGDAASGLGGAGSDGAGGAGGAKSAKERAAAALAAMKKKKMAAASNFLKLPEDAADGNGAAAAASAASADAAADAKSSKDGSAPGGGATDDTALLRGVLGGPALHRYAACFVEESVCAYCHRKGSDSAPLCHLAQLTRNTAESRVCAAMRQQHNSANKKGNNGAVSGGSNEECLQLNFCGHLAHEKCFNDRVGFTSVGMTNTTVFRAVRGHSYLHPGEALCAVCARIVSLAVPAVSAAACGDSRKAGGGGGDNEALAALVAAVRLKKFATQLQRVELAQRKNVVTGGSGSAPAAADVPPVALAELVPKVVCPTIVATALDLQLGKRGVQLREVSGLVSLVALLRDASEQPDVLAAKPQPPSESDDAAAAAAKTGDGEQGSSRDSSTPATSSPTSPAAAPPTPKELPPLPPLSALVQQVLLRSFESVGAIAASVAAASSSSSPLAGSEDNLLLMPLVLDSVQLPAQLLPASSAASASDFAASSLAVNALVQLESAPLGVASFWVRLLLLAAQLGTGRLTDSQLGGIAEATIRVASSFTASGAEKTLEKALLETAADTVTFPLWAPRMTELAAASASPNTNSSSDSNNCLNADFATADPTTTLGVLDAAEEGAHIKAAGRFLFPNLSAMMASSSWSSSPSRSRSDDGSIARSFSLWDAPAQPSADAGASAAAASTTTTEADSVLAAIVSAYSLPTHFRELLPRMRMASRKDDDEAKKKKKDRAGDQLTEQRRNSDEEPETEEEARALEERRRLEEQAAAGNNEDGAAAAAAASSTSEDDSSASATHALIEASSSYVCAECGTVPRIPVMCVYCRRVFCARGSPPELAAHTQRCGGGAGAGVYVQLKITQPLFLQAGIRAQVAPSCFLDRYGEEDVGLRRGRPLTLNGERYRKFLRSCVRASWDHSTAELEDGGTFKTVSTL